MNLFPYASDSKPVISLHYLAWRIQTYADAMELLSHYENSAGQLEKSRPAQESAHASNVEFLK